MALFLFLLLVAVVFGFIGVIVKGLLFLLALGIVVLIVDLIALGFRGGLARRRPTR